MKSFLVGLGVGVGLGLLFAPARGEDTRRELGERLNNIAENARRKGREVAERVRDGVDKDKESRLGNDQADLISEIRARRDQPMEVTQSAARSSGGTGFPDR